MPDEIAYRLRGSEELNRWLKELTSELAIRKMRTALRRAATVIALAVHDEAPQRTGKMAASVDVKVRGGTQSEQLVAQVRIGAWYARLVRTGHIIRQRGKGKKGKIIGHARADDFVERAVARSQDAAVTAAQSYLANAAKRYRRAQARG